MEFNNIDFRPQNIEDFAEDLIKVYPYEIINANTSKNFVKEFAISLVAINQNNYSNLEVDENGNKFFYIAAAMNGETNLDSNAFANGLTNELQSDINWSCLSNYFFTNVNKNVLLGEASFLPAFFTIQKPYNENEFQNGKQQVYMSSNFIEAKASAEESFAIDNEGLYSFNLINIKKIQQNVNGCLIFPVLDFENKDINEIIIQMSSFALLGSIKAKGFFLGEYGDIDFNVKKGLIPIKATPIELNEKLTMFFDWFDYDFSMPEFIAKQFINTPQKLTDLKNIRLDANSNIPFLDDVEIQLVSDMLAYSIAYAESFSQFPRISTGSEQGKLDPAFTIGSKKAKLNALEGKDPIKVIDGLFEIYLRENPNTIDGVKYRGLKQIIAALSRFIYSSYSIGKGQNNFNEIYLPWFLEPVGKIELSLNNTDKNYTYNSAQTYKLASRFFDIKNNQIELKQDSEISNVRLIQTDRKLTIPEVASQIQPIDKLPLPSDVDTKSSKDLRYYWYIPSSKLSFQKDLFLNSPFITSGSPTIRKTFNTNWTPYGINQIYDNSFIKNEASKLFQIAEREISIINRGQLEERFLQVDEDVNALRVVGNLPAAWEGDGTQNFKIDVASVFGVRNPSPASITYIIKTTIVGVGASNRPSYASTFSFSPSRITYEKMSTRQVGVEVEIPNSASTILETKNINRETIFDKRKWQKEIGQIASSTISEIVIDPIDKIERLDEIIITSIFGNYLNINIKGKNFELPVFNKDDESITIQSFLFT